VAKFGGVYHYLKQKGTTLQNKWTLWFFKNDRNRNWEENQRPIITFSTVEDFWALYNHIEQVSVLLKLLSSSPLLLTNDLKRLSLASLFVTL
jgi:Eukaryotic initiation factor 4E